MTRHPDLIYGLPNEAAGYGYVNVPKAACSSIKLAIAEHLGADPVDCNLRGAKHVRRLPYIVAHPELMWFSFVRHPCDRLLSLWADFLSPPYPEAELRMNEDLRPLVGMPFDRFVKAVCRKDPLRANMHYLPQVDLLGAKSRVPLVSQIYHFEQLPTYWDYLRGRFGLPALTHVRKSEHRPWREMYTVELARLVRIRYAEDFGHFGYSI